jgi:hypothetical protein
MSAVVLNAASETIASGCLMLVSARPHRSLIRTSCELKLINLNFLESDEFSINRISLRYSKWNLLFTWKTHEIFKVQSISLDYYGREKFEKSETAR